MGEEGREVREGGGVTEREGGGRARERGGRRGVFPRWSAKAFQRLPLAAPSSGKSCSWLCSGGEMHVAK